MPNKRKLLSASTLSGDKVVNDQEESLGEIKELMLDVDTGRVGYAVLSFGGILGLGDKLFAIPWSALKVDQDNKRFILNIAKDQLKNAPGFDKDNWPDMSDQTWGLNVHNFYKAKPYWDEK